ncbi:MAG: xanthine dehydrogenase family protein subunit M [Armatimonadetes bacterium]|nr:xanthine dehydrogenase family protein subunit M [Armatimonadota bacterium]
MHPFSYAQAAEEQAAIADVSPKPQAKFLAGGTTLVDLMKLNVETPDHLTDITAIPLARIEPLPDGGVRIGALVKNSDLAHDPTIQKNYPVLSEALLSGASPQLRNMATTGGNILQRTRCYYFRDTAMPCNKRQPGSGCPAIDGYNRNHAVLGTSSHCIASNPSDMNVAMAALDAVVVTRGPRGERRIPFGEFHLLPGDHPERETVLEHGELIVAVELPALPFAAHSHYLKVRDRASYAFALASAAAALDVQGGTIRQARLALGGVGTRPWRALDAEKALVGRPAAEDSYRHAADIALHGAKGYKHNAFKIELAKRTVVRCLTIVGQM